MSPHTRITYAQFKREYEEALIDVRALRAQREAFLARLQAEEDAAWARLDAKLRIIGQSLDQLVKAA